MIELNGVTKTFGSVNAVKEVSFKVAEKENLVLLGTSGCGKTTTLKMINRLIEPNAGEILMNGQPVSSERPETLRRSIGYVMQHIGLFPHYTVEENIAVVPRLLKWEQDKIKSRVADLIAKLHLPEDVLQLFPAELSGGQQQRVGLARALAADPPVLLMDEPFGALDNVTRSSIQKEFLELEELQQKTIVMVTHDVEEAFILGDRICLMDKGSIVQMGSPKQLLFDPVNDFARSFLDSQRLALEFKVVTLYDIWKSLPDDRAKGNYDMTVDTSVWHAMEKLRSGEFSELQVVSPEGKTKTFNLEHLVRAFNQYKTSGSYE